MIILKEIRKDRGKVCGSTKNIRNKKNGKFGLRRAGDIGF